MRPVSVKTFGACLQAQPAMSSLFVHGNASASLPSRRSQARGCIRLQRSDGRPFAG